MTASLSTCDQEGSMREETMNLGMSEQEIRDGLEEELIRAMRAEGGVPTLHAIAHSIARILEQDHLRMAEQLESAGVVLEDAEDKARR